MAWLPGRIIPIEKFRDYSLDSAHPQNRGKHIGYESVGFDLGTPESREDAAKQIIERLNAALDAEEGDLVEQAASAYGTRFKLSCVLEGPNGREGQLITTWIVKADEEAPRLTTNWLEVHKKEEEAND